MSGAASRLSGLHRTLWVHRGIDAIDSDHPINGPEVSGVDRPFGSDAHNRE
jgi:hypothetical protein